MKELAKGPAIAQGLFILIVIIAAGLRFWNLGEKSLSNDELSALSRLQVNTFQELMKSGVRPDFHPAGVQVLLYYWTGIFGNSPFSVRVPFALMGILLLLPAWSLGKKWFGVITALLVCVLLGFSEFTLLYSQTARPYISGLLFVLAFTWFWNEIVLQKNRNIFVCAGFAVTLTLCMYNHYFSFLTAAIISLSGLFLVSKRDLPAYLLCGIISILLFLPHLDITLEHFSRGGLSTWLGPPESDSLLNFVKYSFNDSLWLAMLLLSLTVPVFQWSVRDKKGGILSLSWFLIIWAIAHFYSIWVNPVFQYSILIFVLPFLWFFLFGFLRQSVTRLSNAIVIASALFVISSTLFVKKYYSTSYFGEFKKLGQQIEKWNDMLGPDRITHTLNINGPFYIDYYLKKGTRVSSYDLGTDAASLARFRELVEQAGTPYFSHGWSTKPEPDEARSIIREQYPVLVSDFNFPNSAISLFGRGIHPKEQGYSITEDFEGPAAGENSTDLSFSGNNSFKLSKDLSYSPSVSINPDTLDTTLNYVLAEAWFLNPDQSELTLVFSADKGEENVIWRGMDAEPFTKGKSGWIRVLLVQKLPEKGEADLIKVYAWHRKGAPAFVDKLRIRFLQNP